MVQMMREATQAMLDGHRTDISQDADARQLLPLQEQRQQIRQGLVDYGTDCDLNETDKAMLEDGDQTPIATTEGRDFARNLWCTGAEVGAMLNSPNRLVEGLSPFKMFCMQGNVAQVERMLKEAVTSNANSNGDGRPPSKLTHLLEFRESSLRLSALLTIQSVGKNFAAAVPGGAKRNQCQEDCARLLLKYGACPDAKDVVGKTVIHYGAGRMANDTSMKICDMCIRAHKSACLYDQEVELHSLSSESMNGMRGIGRGFVEETNRRAVYLFDRKKEVAVKPENIRLVDTHSTSQPPKKTPLVDIQDRLGSVALHEVVMSNRVDVAKFLLTEHGASYDVIELDGGCTPWSMATTNTFGSAVCPLVVQASVLRGRQEKRQAMRQCQHCYQQEDKKKGVILQVCSRCKMKSYCSRDCQAAAWKAGHNKECKRLKHEQFEGIRLECDTPYSTHFRSMISIPDTFAR